MPLPLLAVFAIPIVAKGAIIVGGVLVAGGGVLAAHKVGVKKGNDEGHKKGVEESETCINKLKSKLQEVQRAQETVKDAFRKVVSDIADLPANDKNFFAKVGAFLSSYTVFHVYVVSCVAYAKVQIIKADLSESDGEELMDLLLGLIKTGFPEKLEKDIKLLIDSRDQNACFTEYCNYKRKLPITYQNKLDTTTCNLNDYIQTFSKLAIAEKDFKNHIKFA